MNLKLEFARYAARRIGHTTLIAAEPIVQGWADKAVIAPEMLETFRTLKGEFLADLAKDIAEFEAEMAENLAPADDAVA